MVSVLPVTGQVQAGESVLIHAGASGVGTAAIQLARIAGAIPLVTVGAQDKLQMAEKLGAAAGFNYREEDFSEAAMKFTKGKPQPLQLSRSIRAITGNPGQPRGQCSGSVWPLLNAQQLPRPSSGTLVLDL